MCKYTDGKPRVLAIVVLAGILHLLLLSTPLVLLNEGGRLAKNPTIVSFLIIVSFWCLVESASSVAEMRLPVRSEGPQCMPLAIGLSLLICFWIMLTEAALSVPTPFGMVAAVGTMFMAAGIVLRCLSLHTLGIWFLNEVAMLPGQPIITHGIYGLLRHPSETGTMCLAFGGVIMLGSACGLTATILLLVPCVVLRTRLEDRMLRNHYPAEFDHYAREVPAFVPRIRIIEQA